MTPAETWIVINSYYDQQNLEFRTGWEKARWIGTCAYNSGWIKKKQSPRELLPFPWENDSVATPQDIESLRNEMGWQIPEQH